MPDLLRKKMLLSLQQAAREAIESGLANSEFLAAAKEAYELEIGVFKKDLKRRQEILSRVESKSQVPDSALQQSSPDETADQES
jgi:hypothetical protein